MRTRFAAVSLLMFLVPASVPAEENLSPSFFVEPIAGTNLATVGIGKGAPYVPSTLFPNGVRGGATVAGIGLDAKLGYAFTTGSHYSSTKYVAGLDARYPFARLLNGTAYGIAGFDLGSLRETQSGLTLHFSTASASAGAGVRWPVANGFSVGPEAGLRVERVSGYGNKDDSTSLTVAFTALFGPGSAHRDVATTADATPTPAPATTPVAVSTPSPSPTPPIGTHGHEECVTWVTDGWMEPAQAVFQDDPSFADRPTKQITREDSPEIHYDAELLMVQQKPTLLFGVDHYQRNGARVEVGSRDAIVLKGWTNCTVKVPVKMKFTLKYQAGLKTLGEAPVGDLALSGSPAPKFVAWTKSLPVPKGFPAQPFTLPNFAAFATSDDYSITDELVRADGAGTGLQMTVAGRAVLTSGPRVTFVGAMITPWTASKAPDLATYERRLVTAMNKLSSETAKATPDLYPLAPGGLPVVVDPTVRHFENENIPATWQEDRRGMQLVQVAVDSISTAAFLEQAGRVVIVLSGNDFQEIYTGTAASTVRGSYFAQYYTWKVILSPAGETWDTIAHELVHSLHGGWSEAGMKDECGLTYHNYPLERVATGVRITRDGAVVSPTRFTNVLPLMGPVEKGDLWISQCTYHHLINELAGGPPDPPLLFLRVWTSRDGKKGLLRPMYEGMGSVDLGLMKPPPGAEWALVARDANGKELARYRFAPTLQPLDGAPQDTAVDAFRIPMTPGWETLELVGPTGAVLDTRRRTARAPEITLAEPALGATVVPSNDEKVRVRWTESGAAGAKLLATVLYSSDAGKTWFAQSTEQPGTEFDVRIVPHSPGHLVKVVVTDGSRSVAAQTAFSAP